MCRCTSLRFLKYWQTFTSTYYQTPKKKKKNPLRGCMNPQLWLGKYNHHHVLKNYYISGWNNSSAVKEAYQGPEFGSHGSPEAARHSLYLHLQRIQWLLGAFESTCTVHITHTDMQTDAELKQIFIKYCISECFILACYKTCLHYTFLT